MLDFFKKAAECYIDAVRFYKTVYELNNLSNEELKELGLERAEIPIVAMKASIKD